MKKGLIIGLAATALVGAACSADRLNVPNPNTATRDAVSTAPGALQLQVTGVFRQLRNGRGAYITATARFGREGYIYTPNEGRNTSHFLIGIPGQNRLDPSGFATGVFAGNYGNLRDIYVTKQLIARQDTLTAAQRSGAMGVMHTIEALELLYVISTRDTLGAVVEIMENPQDLAPFVSRDSVYRFILNTLDTGYNELLAAGATPFPFALHSGFAGFNTPANFARFNRAITVRAAAYHATTPLGGAAAWARAAAAMPLSFANLTATTPAEMNVGVYHPYSTATGDAGNGIDSTANRDFLGHPSMRTQVDTLPNGTRDARFVAKTFTVTPDRNPPSSTPAMGISTNVGLRVYKEQGTPVPIIRNEELILLDAEIKNNTGDPQGAIDQINRVRTNVGGLLPTTLTAASPQAAITLGILYEKRFSLLAEGHRWVDLRRYGLLNTLPLDINNGGTTQHFVARVMPVPQAECLVRVGAPPALAGPGC